jgi:hypothetical protein
VANAVELRIFPFALSLSKGERKNLTMRELSRSCFDKLSTNGLIQQHCPLWRGLFAPSFLPKPARLAAGTRSTPVFAIRPDGFFCRTTAAGFACRHQSWAGGTLGAVCGALVRGPRAFALKVIQKGVARKVFKPLAAHNSLAEVSAAGATGKARAGQVPVWLRHLFSFTNTKKGM